MVKNLKKCTLKNRQKTISEYLEGQLGKAEQEEFEEHIFICDTCFQELRLQEKVGELIKYEGNIIFADALEKRELHKQRTWEQFIEKISSLFIESPSRWIYTSAAVATLLLILFVLIPSRPPIDPQNFSESANLEELISLNLRSAYSFEILSPANGVNVKDEILFQWESDYEGTLFITILNNKEEEVLKISVDNNKLEIEDLDEKLVPGLYYWKLESDRRLFYTGKFFVRKP